MSGRYRSPWSPVSGRTGSLRVSGTSGNLGVCSCIGGRVAGIAGGFLGLLGVDLFRVEGVFVA